MKELAVEVGYDSSSLLDHHQVKQEMVDDSKQQPEFNDLDDGFANTSPSEIRIIAASRGCYGNASFNYADDDDDTVAETQFNSAAAAENDILKMSNPAEDVASQIFLDAERMAQLEREFHEQVGAFGLPFFILLNLFYYHNINIQAQI